MHVLAFAVVAAMPASAAAYRTLADEEGSPTPIVWEDAPTVALDPAGMPREWVTAVDDALQASARTWNDVACARRALVFVRGEAAAADVVVRWVDDWEASGFDPDAAGTVDVVLSSTRTGTAIVGATLSLNAARLRAGDGAPDPLAVITHELGHALGLAHTEDPDASMFGIYRPTQSRLHDDDVAGLCSLYPADPVPPPLECLHEDECPLGHWCIESQCRADLRFGSPCTDGSDCLGARCVVTEEGGACTYVCTSDSDCSAGTSCRSVVDRDERVCAPRAPSAGCTVAARSGPALPLCVVLLTGLVVVLRRPLRRRRGEVGLALGTVLLGGMLASCQAAHDEPADADGTRDGGREDATIGMDAAPPADGGPADAEAGLGDSGPPDSGPPDSGPPDSGPPEPPCHPGATRVASCGFCGSQAQSCDDTGRWIATSDCLGQGECAVGTSETRDAGMCAVEQRICLSGCMFGPWERTSPAGECTPGETRTNADACTGEGETRDERCDDTCAWAPTSACADACGGSTRTTPEWAREVCVSAGYFWRGSTTYTSTQPVQEVYVSSYYIDAYPVTIRRYMECVAAGACTPSPHAGYFLPERLDYPVQELTWEQSSAFCAWDSSDGNARRLPTEAEWEKAVRGPSPRRHKYPWGDDLPWGDTYSCTYIDCSYTAPSDETTWWAAHRYDALPGTRSYYGTYLQIVGVHEHVLDFYSPTFYASPTSLVDPLATEADGSLPLERVNRGSHRNHAHRELAFRMGGRLRPETLGMRCARSAP